jgi:MFS family permease
MGWTSLVNDAASELLYPVLPLFLVTTLHAPVAAVGLVEGAAGAASQIVGYVVGRRSDRIHRRLPFVWAGYTLSNIAKPLVALAPAWGWVLGARVLDRVG